MEKIRNRLILGLLIVGLIWGIREIWFFFHPIILLVKTVAFPIAVAGVIYYLSLPVKRLMENRWKWKTWMSTLGILGLWVVGIVGVMTWMIPVLSEQVMEFTKSMPMIVEDLKGTIKELEWEGKLGMLPGDITAVDIINYGNSFYESMLSEIQNHIVGVVGKVTGFLMVSIMIPLLIFYILKDGHKLPIFVGSKVSKKYRRDVMGIMREMNKQLSTFVQGQVIVSLCVGILMYIGLKIVGMDYALLLAMIGFLTNFIPFIGPIIGAIPALVIALLVSPLMLVKVGVMILVIQQIESNLISPQVMGKRLHIHPITIVILLLVMGKLIGFVGFIIAVPMYVVVKVLVSNGMRIVKLKNRRGKA